MTSLLNQVADARKAATDANWKEYRALLSRNDKPHNGDAEALARVMTALNLTERDAIRHTDALVQANELRGKAASIAKAEAELATAEKARVDATAEMDRQINAAKAMAHGTEAGVTTALAKLSQAQWASSKLAEIESVNWQLFGLAAPIEQTDQPKSLDELQAEQAVLGSGDFEDRRDFAVRVAEARQ